MNEEKKQFQIRQLHPTEDPELDPFPVKDLVTVGGFVLYKKTFYGLFCSVLRTFCKFEIISKTQSKKNTKSNFIMFMTRKQRQNVCQCQKANEHLSRHSNSKSPLQSSSTWLSVLKYKEYHPIKSGIFLCTPLNPRACNCSRLPFSDHNCSLHYCTLVWSTFDYKQCF